MRGSEHFLSRLMPRRKRVQVRSLFPFSGSEIGNRFRSARNDDSAKLNICAARLKLIYSAGKMNYVSGTFLPNRVPSSRLDCRCHRKDVPRDNFPKTALPSSRRVRGVRPAARTSIGQIRNGTDTAQRRTDRTNGRTGKSVSPKTATNVPPRK